MNIVNSNKRLFISVEGVDGSGKSTHARFICEYLTSLNLNFIITREPGGTPLGEALRDILLSTKYAIDQISELLLMFASRQQLIQDVIYPSLQNGVIVVADRFIDASIAYQGAGRGIGEYKVNNLVLLLNPCITPDLTFIFDASLDLTMQRMSKHGQDRIESSGKDFFTRVRESYLLLAANDPNRVKIIDTSVDKEIARAEVKQYLDDILAVRGYIF